MEQGTGHAGTVVPVHRVGTTSSYDKWSTKHGLNYSCSVLASSVFDSLLTAPVIAFVVALVATLARFDLRLPDAMYPILSTFLLLAIGIKGGKALSVASLGDIWKPLIAAVVLGLVTPLVAFAALRVIGRTEIGRAHV